MLRPNLTRERILKYIADAGFPAPSKPFLFAHRPEPSVNKINSYDDTIVLVGPASLIAFNANTDPSRHEPHMATLALGTYTYEVGIHNHSKPKDRQYQALIQAGPVTVDRWPDADPKTPERETGWFGINIHRGGYSTTGSLGCQTIHPDQYDEFLKAVKAALLAANKVLIPYVLVEGK